MVTFYKNTPNKGLNLINKLENNCWINVTNPTQNEIDYLINELQIPVDFINDIEDIDERPRLEDEDGWTLVIMRIPIKNIENMEFATAPLGIIIKDEMVVSICFHPNEVVSDFILFTQRKGIVINNNIDFLLRLILSSSVWYQKYLKHINIRTKMAEKELEKSIKNDELHALLNIEKVLVYFITSLKGNDLLVYKLKNYYRKYEIDEELLEDAEIEIKQAIETTNVHSNILAGMMDAYASIISNNVNEIVKKLTIITIIITIPNVVSGFFGMNLLNYLESHPYAFFIVILLTFTIGGIVFFFFKKSKFF
ncbi:MAG: magnesium transporter CorA family protein [Bacteroidetes bacterium]|nr:magnesium transporter CorA family protein [Bacteroidota bacterium]